MTDKLNAQILHGISWSTISQFGVQAGNFVIGVALARMLSPNEFGLMGMLYVLTGFVSVFTQLGFGAALIHKKNVDQRHFSSVFWVNVCTGLFLMVALMLCAPLVAKFYNEPILRILTMLIATNFLIGSFSIVHKNLLQKQINFKTIAIVEIITVVASGSVAILMANSGFGVWSLAAHAIATTCISTILFWFASSWKPVFIFKWKAVKELWGFSSNLLGFSVFNYWVRNADNLIIGRFLGSDALGVYSKAYTMMLFPLTNISRVLASVMFPAFSLIQDDTLRVGKMYLRVSRAVALIAFPLMLGLFVLAKSFILAVFGSQWGEMIPILKLFCIVGMIQSIGTLNGTIYQSQGRTKLQFKVGAAVGVAGVFSIFIGLKWGIFGVACAYTIFSLLVVYPSISIAVSLLDMTFKKVVKNISSIFYCAIGMAVSVWLIGQKLPSDWPHWLYVLFQVPFGCIIYLLLLHVFKVHGYNEMLSLVNSNLRIKNDY